MTSSAGQSMSGDFSRDLVENATVLGRPTDSGTAAESVV
jgi:hypothetical protein